MGRNTTRFLTISTRYTGSKRRLDGNDVHTSIAAKAKARIALTGVSGSGKTLGALYLAYGLTGDWAKVALIDTEHERARFYANRSDLDTGAFLWASLEPPYSPERYKAFVQEAAEAVGEDGVVIVDSFSHAWNNEGGVMDIKERIAATQRGKNDYTAWGTRGGFRTIWSTTCCPCLATPSAP